MCAEDIEDKLPEPENEGATLGSIQTFSQLGFPTLAYS
jgi:hypothetical protein